MNIDRFGEGFERPPRRQRPMTEFEWEDVRKSGIDPSKRWSLFFSRIVEGYTNGLEFDKKVALNDLDRYAHDTQKRTIESNTTISELLAFHDPKLTKDLGPMNFHTINQHMIDNWPPLIGAYDTKHPKNDHYPDYYKVVSMQTKLAMEALRLVRVRRNYFSRTLEERPSPTKKDLMLDNSFKGRITELDAAVALLEMTKRRKINNNEKLIVVPGPILYESHGSKASDFLLFDLIARQAIGIQVKTRNAHDFRYRYNSNYVVMLDGMYDLGNVTEPVGKSGKINPFPGLLSADFILNNEDIQSPRLKGVIEFGGIYGQLLHARKEISPMNERITEPGHAKRAAEKIEPKLIQALHVAPTEK